MGAWFWANQNHLPTPNKGLLCKETYGFGLEPKRFDEPLIYPDWLVEVEYGFEPDFDRTPKLVQDHEACNCNQC